MKSNSKCELKYESNLIKIFVTSAIFICNKYFFFNFDIGWENALPSFITNIKNNIAKLDL